MNVRLAMGIALGAALSAASVVVPGAAAAQSLAGRVLDESTAEPIAGSVVSLMDADGRVLSTVVTAADGAFTIEEPDPPAPAYRLRVDRVGYGRAEAAIRFEPGRTLDVDVLLSATAISLDPIVVTEERTPLLAAVGFEARRGRGVGIFIDRMEVEERSPARVTDLLRGRSGIRVVSFGDEEDVRVTGGGRRLHSADCQPAIWIDGTRVRKAGPPEADRVPSGSEIRIDPVLTQLVGPYDIEGLEVYPGPAGLPVRFRTGDADCGTILVWTRR